MLVAFCAALAAAIVCITFVQTWSSYGTLPDKVPMSIGFGGTVNAYGPRPMIWLLPAVMLVSSGIFVFAGYALANNLPGTHGSLRGMAAFAPCEFAILWRAQLLLISGAKYGGSRVPMSGFWPFFVAMLAAGIVAIVFL